MEKDFANKDAEAAYVDRSGSFGGGEKDRRFSAGRRMSAAEQAAEAQRRQSVAVNLVENPLQVGHFLPCLDNSFSY